MACHARGREFESRRPRHIDMGLEAFRFQALVVFSLNLPPLSDSDGFCIFDFSADPYGNQLPPHITRQEQEGHETARYLRKSNLS